jgi:voltage-gated sodium channel
MESTKVKGFFGILVCLNGLTIGIQADHYSDHIVWDICEYVFITLFTIELGLKLIAYKHLFWTDTWNVADFVIVLVSIVEIVMGLAIGYTSAEFPRSAWFEY